MAHFLDLDTRVRLPDGREGFLLGSIHQYNQIQMIWVMLDSYIKVTCRHDQITVIKRKPIGLVKGEHEHKVYPIELQNNLRLQGAIQHAYWQGGKGPDSFDLDQIEGKRVDFARAFLSGQRESMPLEEDIRESEESAPRQLNLL